VVRTVFLVFTIALAACGGKPGPVNVDTGPAVVVGQFMQAVADSNFNRMAQLWGSTKGSATETGQPQDYQRRIAVMWAYLRGSTATVRGEVERTADRSVLAVDVERADCRRRVPFTLVRANSGVWLIESFDLAAVGVPGTPCPSEQRVPPAG
jgi:hypothetical protein